RAPGTHVRARRRLRAPCRECRRAWACAGVSHCRGVPPRHAGTATRGGADPCPRRCIAAARGHLRRVHRGCAGEPDSACRRCPAPRLAELILALDSVDLPVGTSRVRVTGFSLDLWSVYEAFVCTALGRALERFGGRATSQFRTHLDSGSTVPLRPDLVWERGGRVQVVVDAKYKETRLDRFPNADLYQLLAYCTALRRQHGHLVYAQGEGAVRACEVREAGITIHCHPLDPSQPPAGLLEQIDRLAARLARPV